MKTFFEWLYLEDSAVASQLDWQMKTDVEWEGKLYTGHIVFSVSLWASIKDGETWNLAFSQAGYTQYSVDMPTLIELFQALDQVMIELFQSDERIKRIYVNPEAVTPKRLNQVKQRYPGEKNSHFDPGKFNAYQFLFQHSQLRKLGFRMETYHGKNIAIVRPEEDTIK